ncbi:Napsa, partial [Symbiodinium microadriaticum]
VALAAAVALAFNLLPASGFDDGVSLLSVVLQNRSKKVQLPPTEGTEGAGPILIPLTRLRGNATGASWRNSSYVGELFLGRPQLQRLTVTFDTASGQVILPSSRCRSLACLEHQRYAPRASTSSREINADGSQVRVPAGARTIRRDAITVGVTSIDHGSGRAYGDLIYDRLCFGGVARKAQCASLGFVGVTNMSDAPFRDMLQDGLVGLGLAQLAANPIFHVLSRLDLPSGMARRFGVFLQAGG